MMHGMCETWVACAYSYDMPLPMLPMQAATMLLHLQLMMCLVNLCCASQCHEIVRHWLPKRCSYVVTRAEA